MATHLDLNRYFERIGYGGPATPTVETLHALSAAHVGAIPFENLDVLLGRPIAIEPEALFDKLVVRRRGGYCFEQNGFFLEVLRQLGFEVTPLSARVRLRHPRSHTPPRTHVFLRVVIDREPWLADFGLGAASLTAALRFDQPGEQPTPHEPRRIIDEDGRRFHQIKYGDTWADVCEFTGEEMPLIDRVIGNWYTSTHPQSHFKAAMMAARSLPEGRRMTLLNRELNVRESNGHAKTTAIDGPAMLLEVLRTELGLTGFSEDDAARLFAIV